MFRPAAASRQSGRSRRGVGALALTLLFLAPSGASFGCGSQVNLKEALAVIDFRGGWYDAGIVNGKNKLVPSAEFRLEKKTDDRVGPVALSILFKRLEGGVEQDFEDVFLQRVEFTDSNRTTLLKVRPEAGYTGEAPQTRQQMLENSNFVDVRAIIFVRQGATWIELARLDLPRSLIIE